MSDDKHKLRGISRNYKFRFYLYPLQRSDRSSAHARQTFSIKEKKHASFLDHCQPRFGWDVFGHPSYSPDLTPSDFHLFLHLKSFLAGKHFNNDKELKENVSNWLKTQTATFYEEGIEKLVPRYDTCLQNFSSYVER
ncbi:histone-lysine N-methyltransferase SETMAR [Trichonephila clavipes]|nr:histone-lysine N-methyltransferase SETMAR [Trichonephila clavipes]